MKTLTLFVFAFIFISLVECGTEFEQSGIEILSIEVSSLNIKPGGSTTITIIVNAQNDNEITITWSSTHGTFNPEVGNQVVWTAPDEEGVYILKITASNITATAEGSVTMTVAQ